jgi:hypothetical protein
MKISSILCWLGAGLLALPLSNPVRAAEAEASKPAAPGQSVDPILDKYVEAIGGKEAVRKVNSRVLRGTLENTNFGLNTPWTQQTKAPNKQVSHVEIPGLGAIRDGFDGTVAWSQNPMAGNRVKEGDEGAKAKRDAAFYRDLDLKTAIPGLALKGETKVGTEEAYVLEGKPTPTSLERLYFSKKSGLMLGQDSELTTADGAVSTKISLDDWRPVEGIKIAHSLRLKVTAAGQPEMEFTIKLTEVKLNVPLEDSLFQKPQ